MNGKVKEREMGVIILLVTEKEREKTINMKVIKDNSPIETVYIGVCRNFYAGFHEIRFV